MKSTARYLVIGLFLTALAGGWIYLYTHSRAVDGERQSATLALLTELKQIDSDWNADVLKSQSEINLSYDPLAVPLHRFREIFDTLLAETTHLEDDKLGKASGEIERLIGQKSALIDRFKAQNALLKNSLRYAPTASREIQAQLHQSRGAGSNEMESIVASLLSDALRYNTVPDTETAEVVKAGMDKLRNLSLSASEAQREAVDNLLSHLSVIVRLREAQSTLLQDIAQIPVAAKIDGFNNMLSERFQKKLTQQFAYQRVLLGYSALALLLVFGAAGFIAYRNATERRRLTTIVHKQTTELKENHVQLVHAQKMNALGEMVAGITHEINTPLAAVKSGLQSSNDLIDLVRQYVEESGKLTNMLATNPSDEAGRIKRKMMLIELLGHANELREELTSFDAIGTVNSLLSEGLRNVEYIHQVITNMLNFSRLDRSRIATVKVEDGIDSVLLIARHMLKKATLHKSYGETKPIQCDIAQINQVVLNLIKNAAQALPEADGMIAIETSAGKDEFRIVVKDNGAGIPADIVAKIWEPFFTTKKAGSGTGLGLSTCKKIIESHGGRIEVASEAGKGTAFTITLPTVPPESLFEQHGQDSKTGMLAVA
ncbi:MAG: two-component system, NtrC family, sensor kinase [Burkholderiales bacterium]